MVKKNKNIAIKIEEADFSPTALRRLRSIEVKSLSDVIKYCKSDLLKKRNFGDKTVSEIIVVLKKHGLKLSDIEKKKKKSASKKAVKIEKKNKVKKHLVRSRKEFRQIKEHLEKIGADFLYTTSGSINSIIYDGHEWVCVDTKSNAGLGHHISKLVRSDVGRWLEEFGADMPIYERDYKEQMFSLDNIEKVLGQPVTMIDINECYWQTIRMLPLNHPEKYIREVTFIRGLKNKEWKVGRNASIGSMAKTKYLTAYKKGKPDYINRPKPITSEKEYQSVRNHIIGHVYRLFFELYQILDTKFYMFLTDCVVTDYSSSKLVEDFFKKHGYSVKQKPVEFTKVDRVKKKIYWWDFTTKNKDKDGHYIGKGREKYYQYAMHQVVDGLSTVPIQYKSNTLKPSTDFKV